MNQALPEQGKGINDIRERNFLKKGEEARSLPPLRPLLKVYWV